MTTSINGAGAAPGPGPVVVDVRPQDEPNSPTNEEQHTPAPTADIDPERVAEAARKVEELFQSVRRNLQFRDDPTSGRMIVSVIDADSGEIIRQIPPEQMLRMAANLERLNGLLLGERA